ncbi:MULTISPECIES: nucleoside triphosphate pyrophosphohydrolase family protein [Propionispora]|uniref:DUF1573 domain-containing protein n=2 Tax=Propionispora TaxID=112902 RepID=A0A1H8XY47_9FIRM|nr:MULTISPECIES: DUF1573 domain-containing protein [Propionispora]SEP44789.1 hypothetical protein SAMN04490178_13316 [Propionispora vibrioides]SHJ76889.1 hypothetical protein SAMN02745170_03279 [Propionispora hippei DSM 15287]
MTDKCCRDFQLVVDQYLIRHRSILDVLTKYQESSARISRAFAKAVTECGCIDIQATRQKVPSETEYSDLLQFMSSHVSGRPCPQCQEVLSKEIGHSLFYLAALCNHCGVDMQNIFEQELKTVKTLGVFHLS